MLKLRLFFVVSSLILSAGCLKDKSAKQTLPPNQDPLVTADTDFLYERGIMLKKRGEYIASDDYLKAAMAKGVPEKRVIPHLVDNALRSNRYSMALQYLKPLLDKEPENWHLRFLSGTLRLGLEQYSLAEIELKRVIELAPKEGEPYFVLAQLYSEQWGKSSQARKHYLDFLGLVPDGTKSVVARRWLHEHPLSSPEHSQEKQL